MIRKILGRIDIKDLTAELRELGVCESYAAVSDQCEPLMEISFLFLFQTRHCSDLFKSQT